MMKLDAISLRLTTEGQPFLPLLKGDSCCPAVGSTAHGWDREGAWLCSEHF